MYIVLIYLSYYGCDTILRKILVKLKYKRFFFQFFSIDMSLRLHEPIRPCILNTPFNNSQIKVIEFEMIKFKVIKFKLNEIYMIEVKIT